MTQGKPTVWDEANKARLRQMRLDGLTVAQMANAFGLAENTIRGRIQKMGDLPAGTSAKHDWDKIRPELRRLRARGASWKFISAKLGIPEMTLCHQWYAHREISREPDPSDLRLSEWVKGLPAAHPVQRALADMSAAP